jgi:type VI secretion system protein VasJ
LEKSKDLLVVVYFAYGLYQKESFSGLAKGLRVCQEMVETFWENLYPELKRKRGRIAALSWLSERLIADTEELQVSSQQKEAYKECSEAFKKLDDFLADKLGDDFPGFLKLTRRLDEFYKVIEAEEKEKEAKKKQPTQTLPSQTPSAPSVSAQVQVGGDIASVEDATRIIAEAQNLIKRAAHYLFTQNPANPLPYRVLRMINWMKIDKIPPNNNGVTQIPGIPADLSNRFQQMVQNNDWQTLLHQAETKCSEVLFWLDAHRYVVLAMDALGPSYEEAKKAVCIEVASFVRRMPEILNLQFKSGIPFASGETKLWIESELLSKEAHSENLSSSASFQEAGSNKRLNEVIKEAKSLVSKGKLKDAILLFQEGLTSIQLRKERFLWRLELAKLCLAADRPELAKPQLDLLDNEITRFSLEDWEPRLCIDTILSLLDCQQRLLKKSRVNPAQSTEETKRLYDRLCRLDMASALAFNGKF